MMVSASPSSSLDRSAAAAGQAAQRASAPPSPDEVFQKMDTGGKGYLTQDDLQSAIVAISPQGAQLSAQDAAAAAQAEVTRMDSDQDGQVSQQEFVQAGPPGQPPGGDGGPPGAAAGSAPAGAGRPAGGDGDGGGGPRGGGGGAGGSAAASSATTYEPADANRDGKVTQPEQQAYDQKHPQQAQAARTYAATAEAG